MSEGNLCAFHSGHAKLRMLAASVLLLYPVLASPFDHLIRKDIGSFKLTGRATPSKSIKQLADGKPRVLLFLRGALSESACQALSTELKRVQTFGLPFAIVSGPGTIRDECFGATKLDAPSELISLLKLGAPGGAEALVLVVDADGVIRHADALTESQDSAKRVADQLISWEQGRQMFTVHCGHYHGDDGAETTYVGIKALAGISGRLSEEKILDGGEMFGSVPISTWSQQDREILVLFIRGL
jgi:hypothetical protein